MHVVFSSRAAYISIHAPREGCDGWECCSLVYNYNFNPRTPRGVRPAPEVVRCLDSYFNPRTPRGVRRGLYGSLHTCRKISIHAPREGCDTSVLGWSGGVSGFQSTHPARGATPTTTPNISIILTFQSTHPARGATFPMAPKSFAACNFNPRTPRGVRRIRATSTRPSVSNFNPRTPRGVRQQTLPKSREFAWLNLLICTRGRRLSIQKQTRLCSIKLSFMLFGCEPAGEGVSSWTSHATKSKVRLEGRSA